MKVRNLVNGAIALTSFAAAHPSRAIAPRQQSSNVLPPKMDPWYTAPDGFASAAPGTVLRSRPAPGNITSIMPNCGAAFNLLYRTTDSQYQPAWAVTTLLIPRNPQYNSNNNLVSAQIPYDSADLDASPSYSLYSGGYSDVGGVFLGRGYWVNVPDFEGPLASFTAGVTSGYATLDSVRAALSFGKNATAISSSYTLVNNTRYIMWGYSGGALASEWAAELQVQYAPEMNFSGAALGGVTPNITTVLLAVTGTIEAGLIPPGVVGLATQWPDLMAFLRQNIYTEGPYNQTTFFSAQNMSLGGTIETFAGQDISRYFRSGFAAFQEPAALRAINSDGVMGYHGVPQMPLFVYKAIKDEVSRINETDALVERFCGVGVRIHYDRNSVGSHPQEYINGQPRVYDFLSGIFNGTYNPTGCQIQNVTIGTEG